MRTGCPARLMNSIHEEVRRYLIQALRQSEFVGW